MSYFSIFLLAVGLAMDATAVSAARALLVPSLRLKHSVLVALFFGGSQALMPLIGWVIGTKVGPFIASWDHWLAFALLAFIGGKMLWEARGGEDEDDRAADSDPFGLWVMTVLAIATSIDALAVGITLPLLQAPLLGSVLTIGVTTALLSIAGLYAGRKLGAHLGARLDVLGGVVLVGLGVKILVEHLVA